MTIHFRGLPKLLLSATHLVHLELWQIPHSGYISPEVMVTFLSMLTSRERLGIRFKSPQGRPDRKNRRPPPRTRTLLPVLTELRFGGVNEYLEDLAARIDAPLLNPIEACPGNYDYVAARQLASHPIAVSRWERKWFEYVHYPIYIIPS
jgi:hypothetical protein